MERAAGAANASQWHIEIPRALKTADAVTLQEFSPNRTYNRFYIRAENRPDGSTVLSIHPRSFGDPLPAVTAHIKGDDAASVKALSDFASKLREIPNR